MSDILVPPRPALVTAHRPVIIPPAIPPVPRRKDSLPPGSNSGKRLSRTLTIVGTIMSRVGSDSLAGDETTTACTFEDKNLWKDCYRILYDFYKNKELCDVEICVGKKAIKCHRVVLACASRYFKLMFTSEMAESRQASITIKDIDEMALEQLVKFAYTAKITLTTDNVQSLLYASSILQVENVALACCEFMKTHLHPTNCIGIRTFAEQHGRTELTKRADQYALDRFMAMTECEEFNIMTAKHLEMLIASQDLNVGEELHVYEAIMKWVQHDVDNRKVHLPALISKVKLALLPATYLMEKVCSNDLLKRDLECRDYLDEAKNYQLSLANVVPGLKLTEKVLPRKSCAGVVFCVGGRGASGDPFKSIECYDLRRDRWFHVTEMCSRRRHVGVVSVGGKLYAIGGHDGAEHLNSGEVFDPTLNKWKPISPMSTPRRGIALATMGGPVYAVGGLDDTTCFNIVERYDPESDTWSSVQPMDMPRGGVAVCVLKNYLYAIGGNDGTASLESCERYDPHLNKWSSLPKMKTRRAGAGVAELCGYLYVIGGFDDNAPLDSVERYDPATRTWIAMSKMSCPRGGVGVAALGGRIYAVGGHDGSNYLNSVEAYDSMTDSWEAVSSIAVLRAGAGVSFCDIPVTGIQQQKQGNVMAVTSCV